MFCEIQKRDWTFSIQWDMVLVVVSSVFEYVNVRGKIGIFEIVLLQVY